MVTRRSTNRIYLALALLGMPAGLVWAQQDALVADTGGAPDVADASGSGSYSALPPTLGLFDDTAEILAAPSVEIPAPSQDAVPKRLFGIIPNYRADQTRDEYRPLTPSQKFGIATRDSFDWPNFFLLAGYAIQGQVADRGFSHGALPVFGEFYARAMADAVISNYTTEAILPTLLHEDPRYFRLGQGSAWHRVLYATSRVFITRTDSGRNRFNFSEVAGNVGVVAVATLYYPNRSSLDEGVERYGIQLGNDMISNLLTEFWPDLKRHMPFHHH